MKILFLTNQFPNKENPTQGTFNVSRAESLIKLGHIVKVISPIGLTPNKKNVFPIPKIKTIIREIRHKKRIQNSLVEENIEVFYPKWFWLPRRFFWKFETFFLHLFAGSKIKRIVTEFNPDLIITTWLHPYGTYANYIEKYYSKKIVTIAEGSDLLEMPFEIKGWSSIENSFNRSSSELIFVSNQQQNFVERELHLKQGKVIVNGFNHSSFYYTKKPKKANNKQLRLITVGSLYPVKGYDLILKALLILGKNFHLTIIGDGFMKDEYLTFVKENKLNDQVVFLGTVPNAKIKIYLEEADIYCQPSRSESFGIAALEAMGCGLPVVVSNVGGMSEMVTDDFNGYVFEKDSIDELVNKIILASRKKWDQEAIAVWAKKNYSWDKWAQKILTMHHDSNILN